MDTSLFEVLPRTAGPGADGRLTVGGCALADVAAEFGTPALVFDEQGLREVAREYRAAFRGHHEDSDVHFASKALRARRCCASSPRRGSGATSPPRASSRSRWPRASTRRTSSFTATPRATRTSATRSPPASG